MAEYDVTEQEFVELEQKERSEESLTAVEAFRLSRERARRAVPRNKLEEIAHALRNGPWAGRK